MKSYVAGMTKFFAALALITLASLTAHAQQSTSSAGRLRLESLDRLAPKAAETVNVEVDGTLISFVVSLLSDKDPEERAIKRAVVGLRGVYVKSFEFKGEGQFAEGDLSELRSQLAAPVWSRMIDIKTRGVEVGDAEVYVAREAGRVEGLALLVVEPKEVTVINIVGTVDIEKLRQLEDAFNLPKIRIERKTSKVVKTETKKKQ